MKLRIRSSLSYTLALALFIYACGPKNAEEESSSDEFSQADEQLKESIQEVVYEIPSPSEIPFLLEATGAEFNETLISDNNKADEYSSRNDVAALNLGVFATDIGYLVSYDKVQEALTYMSSAKKLADNLGVTGSFDTELIKRFEAYLSE